MSAVRATTPQPSAFGTETNLPAQAWRCGTAALTARWGRSGGVVAVHGEIDAANADEFTDQLQGCADSCEWLALDLGSLEFIGTAGFAALRTLNTWFTKAEISWLLVPGTAVSRLLAVCDPDSDLPMAESIAHALTTLQNPRRLRPAPYPA